VSDDLSPGTPELLIWNEVGIDQDVHVDMPAFWFWEDFDSVCASADGCEAGMFS
jgi:hypothetical protein